jgi:hypothetical protein
MAVDTPTTLAPSGTPARSMSWTIPDSSAWQCGHQWARTTIAMGPSSGPMVIG